MDIIEMIQNKVDEATERRCKYKEGTLVYEYLTGIIDAYELSIAIIKYNLSIK